MKVRTSISVEAANLEKAQVSKLNISEICNTAIKLMANPVKSDAPEDALQLKCTQCSKLIDYGFLCENRNMFLCQECQDKIDLSKCKHDERHEHSHIRIPGFEGQNEEMIKKIGLITKC